MEKLNNIIINEYNSHSLLTSCLYIDKYDIMACGDSLGRLLIFDHRVPKPFVQLIISGNKNEISNIQYSSANDELFFSIDDTIYSCDNITNSYTKKIISNNNIKTNIINENEDGEITDFLLLPDNTIVYPEQEQETFLFYSPLEDNKNDKNDKKENKIIENNEDEILPYQEIDKFFLSSAYGEEYIPSMKKILLYSFDGEIFLYDYKTKQTKNNIQIKKYLDNSEINSISNPPYLNKVILNKDNNEIICGMMNGYIIGLKSSLKKTKMKSIHNGCINDIKMSKFKIHNYKEIITYGRDKCLKFIDPQNSFNIDYYADMTCNIIDFDSDIHGNIFYIDDSTKMLYMMKFK
jgi:hypothetical protein